MTYPFPIVAFSDRPDCACVHAESLGQSHVRERIALTPLRSRVWQRHQAFQFAHLSGRQFLRSANVSIVQSDVQRLRFQYLKVSWSVVVAFLILVVNNFTWNQRPSDLLFSDEKAAANVALTVCSWVIWHLHRDVTVMPRFAAIPAIGVLASRLMFRCVSKNITVPLPPVRYGRYRLSASAGAGWLWRLLGPFNHYAF